MRYIITTYFFVSTIFLILNNHIQADSIWKRRITLNTNLFSDKGDYESNRNINLELTAVVTEMLANGNLIIEGNRDVNVNGEKYTIKLSGIVRPIDISIDNEVQSTSIANANIILEGKGFLTRAGKRGWWNRIREVVWPF